MNKHGGGALALLLGLSKDKKEYGGGDDDGDLKSFARDFLDAIKDDDEDALAIALKGAVHCAQVEIENDESDE